MVAKINFNGQEYDSPEAMPLEVRQLYQMMTSMLADNNQDGMPDIFDGVSANVTSNVFQTTQFVVDGKAYSSLDELPAEARRKYEQKLGQFDANRNGIPDLLEQSPFGAAMQLPAAAPPAAQSFQEPKVTVIGEGRPFNRATIMLIGGALVLLVVILGLYLIGRF
jgi:hypothetical protein